MQGDTALSDLPFKPGNVRIDYTNHAGVRSIREIVPLTQGAFRFGSTEWHPEEQWLLDAYDVAKDDMRTFAVKDIHAWAPKDTATGRSMASYAKQLQQSMERNARMVNRLKELQSICKNFNYDGVVKAIDLIVKDQSWDGVDFS
jgi:predicted DNA-binding transcriptional regulator YafY